jgi:2-polyprenyl-6-methoxyphenol hydroxylase-like FAD-dependent oxidoreductase
MSIAIVGAGVGGLKAALSLHAAGRKDVVVFKTARELRDVGVTELGLRDALDNFAVPETIQLDRSRWRVRCSPYKLKSG